MREQQTNQESEPSKRWRVLKFGGTSVATGQRWKAIEHIIRTRMEDGVGLALVCSAVSGVTNLLVELVRTARSGGAVEPILAAITDKHRQLGSELDIDADKVLQSDLTSLAALVADHDIDPAREARILSHGEMMSTRLGAAWLTSRDVPCAWVDARDLLEAEPSDAGRAEAFLSASCPCDYNPAVRDRLDREGVSVIITQGFIARGPESGTVLLGRGGSDTSAAYLAGLVQAERLEIWTDVPGLFTANPRVVPSARLLTRVGYREAQALGALGAEVLHPRAIEAALEQGVPVEIGWTAHPEIEGTRINATRSARGVKAITSRRKLVLFSLRRPPSWQPIGFMSDVANCFSRRGLSMDLVSSSCSEIRATVDLAAFPSAEAELESILEELDATCEPRLLREVASVSLVGTAVGNALLGHDRAFGLFADEAVYMVVHAANEHHVSFVLDESAASELVAHAHEQVLAAAAEESELGPTWTELLDQIGQRAA